MCTKTWTAAPLLLAAICVLATPGCAGRSLTDKSADDENLTVAANDMRRTKAPAPSSAAKRPAIATVSHTEPARTNNNKPLADKQDKRSFTNRFSQARGLESAGKLDEAREIYQQLISEFPERWEPYHRLGLVADRQRRFPEAESLLSEALRRKPMDAELFGDLGYCYYLQGKLEKAESALTKAISIKPSESRYRNNLGLVYGSQGRDLQALEAFRHAGSEADAQYNMAFVLATRNDMAGAKKRFQVALNVDPKHEGARRALRSFEQADREGDEDFEPELTADGRRWEPYVENATQTGNSLAKNPASREKVNQARGMVQNRMAERQGR